MPISDGRPMLNGGMNRRYVAEAAGTFGIVFAPVALSGAANLERNTNNRD